MIEILCFMALYVGGVLFGLSAAKVESWDRHDWLTGAGSTAMIFAGLHLLLPTIQTDWVSGLGIALMVLGGLLTGLALSRDGEMHNNLDIRELQVSRRTQVYVGAFGALSIFGLVLTT